MILKCPFCNFRNVHEEEILHHIRYKDDPGHNVDVGKIDKKMYILVTKIEGRYRHTRKEDLPSSMWPSIKCLWCEYTDKLPHDLERHFIEEHKKRLYEIKITPGERARDLDWKRDPFSWMYSDIDYRLYKAVQLAKGESRVGEIIKS